MTIKWNEVNRCDFYIYSQQTTGSEFFKLFLGKEFNANVNYMSIDKKIDIKPTYFSTIFLLVDIRHTQTDIYHDFITNLKDTEHLKILYFNFEITKKNIKLLCKTPNFWGVFQPDDSIESITFGLNRVLDGYKWIDNKVLLEMLEETRSFYPKTTVKNKEKQVELTKRQLQILKLIKLGASNIEISRELNIAENTVKTHIHSLFKKLNVKSRVQAIAKYEHYL
ncbi:helix-turn-helix transcriptional regulator [Vibrio diabolicus]|uniref:helix-turn-helix transcriptional regulator n=1 Tax=Vibrio diabolicus TaxID=50719 RepID=UPI00211AE099|nr:response regulator transcription factor [Vibrio diabolicus]MCG6283762.1 response regulator transcription factor [Vibrio diabolicus]MCR9307222.1 response regulator transcription factor [Vibrio diabolicus]